MLFQIYNCLILIIKFFSLKTICKKNKKYKIKKKKIFLVNFKITYLLEM
jgi:hypothetical protein